jgi:anti-sigma factor RsiW
MHLEDNLKRALARQSAPDGFAERVMNAVSAEARPSPGASRHPLPGGEGRGIRRGWRAIAAGLVLTAVAGGWAAEKAIERREGERAREEVLVALHIASAKVRVAQQHVHEIGSH